MENTATIPAGDPSAYPRITIVTPSFNQGVYLERTIRSVLDQNYPNLEYIIIDGGSTDGSVEIIRKYRERLAYWVSEPDQGHYAAINKGFARSSGEIMAWLNADDLYFPWALELVAHVFIKFPEVAWLTSLLPTNWNARGEPFYVSKKPGFARGFFLKGYYMADARHYCRHSIQQESTFWRRSLWNSAGGQLDTSCKLAGDFELWSRFFMKAPLVGLQALLGGFRLHGEQRSIQQREQYFAEAEQVFQSAGGKHCNKLEAWICRSGLPSRWPLNVLPSLGFIQPATNVLWNNSRQVWEKRDLFIS